MVLKLAWYVWPRSIGTIRFTPTLVYIDPAPGVSITVYYVSVLTIDMRFISFLRNFCLLVLIWARVVAVVAVVAEQVFNHTMSCCATTESQGKARITTQGYARDNNRE